MGILQVMIYSLNRNKLIGLHKKLITVKIGKTDVRIFQANMHKCAN